MATNEELRPSNRPANAGLPWLRPLVAVVAIAAALGLVMAGRLGHEAHTPARFLTEALGAERSAPLAPVRKGSATARIATGRLLVESARRDQVGLSARVSGSRTWERRANGEWRATRFGSEAITLGTDDPEHFLTVDRRVGVRTWTWKLETDLHSRLLPNGGVGFVDSKTRRVTDLTIAPVAIFDSGGKDVTPAGLRWELGGGGKTLRLNLNDESLPEPYVIDPAFRSIGTVAAGAAAATVAPAVPAGVVPGDQLIAFVSSTAATATLDVAPPAGWTLVRTDSSTTFVKLWTFRKQATASEPATYTFTFQDPTGTNVNKTSRAIVAAYSGIMSSAPIDGNYGNNSAGASNRTANVPGVSTTGTNRISIWTIANSGTATTTNPTINAVVSAERIDSTTAPSLEVADAAEPTAFGPATVGTGNVLSAAARWAAQVFSLIPDTTAPTQTLAVTEGTNPAGQFFNSTTSTHYYNTAAVGDFTVTSTPADADSGVASVAWAALALTGFTHTANTDNYPGPYVSNAYAWTAANTTSPGANQATVTDRNANTVQGLTITRDVTAPTVFTLNAPTGGAFIKDGATVSVAAGNPTDAGAGVTNVTFRACPGSNGCVWADADVIALGADTTDQYSVTWPAGQADGAYQVIARATDNVGNVRDTAAPVNVTLDNTNPSQALALNSVSQIGGL
ncbi:MAG: hypothetical protein QOJ43_213, partial [Gaiellaceae bacterium]|nr:hypothetical protein [Gaiellaceae bacterium]